MAVASSFSPLSLSITHAYLHLISSHLFTSSFLVDIVCQFILSFLLLISSNISFLLSSTHHFFFSIIFYYLASTLTCYSINHNTKSTFIIIFLLSISPSPPSFCIILKTLIVDFLHPNSNLLLFLLLFLVSSVSTLI